MYILRQKWSQLNAVQREQILGRYKAQLADATAPKNERLYLHNIYAMSFRIHPKSGIVLFV